MGKLYLWLRSLSHRWLYTPIAFLLWVFRESINEWVFGDFVAFLKRLGVGMSGWEFISQYSDWFVGGIILLGVIGSVFWAATDTKRKYEEHKDKRVQASQELSRLLPQMHKHISKLRSEVASQPISKDVLDDVIVLLADAFNFIKLEDLDDTIENIYKSVDKKTKKSKDSRLLAIHVYKQLQIPQKEWTTQDSLVIANTLDSKNIGIAQKRDIDRKWRRLYERLQSFKERFVDILDASVSHLIDHYMDHSYGLNSFLLHLVYLKRLYPEEYMIPELSRLNVSSLVMKMNNEMAELLIEIVKRIKTNNE